MRTQARLLPVVAASLLLGGCLYVGDFDGFDSYREDFHSTHPLESGGSVSIETFNGSIELAGWEQNSVEVNGTKYASTKSALDDIKVDVSSPSGSVRVRASKISDFHRNMGMRFTVRVPK